MELVVGASEATIKSLLGKLGDLLAQEYTLIRGVRGDIQYINDELASMQAFLGDLGSSMDDHDRRLKHWMKQIRDMAYDMEDCIDDFAHRLPHDSSLGDRRCSFIVTWFYELWTCWPRHEIASKIAELKVRAQQTAERRSRYGVDNPSRQNGSSSGTVATRAVTEATAGAEYLMASRQLIHTQNPMGVDEHMKNLRLWLNTNNKGSHLAVLSIFGFGGVGKTTIATALYQDFRNEFDCRALITVSQNYDEDQVLRDILNQIKPHDRNIGTLETNLAGGIKTPHDREQEPQQQDDRNTESMDKNLAGGIKNPHDREQEQQDDHSTGMLDKKLVARMKGLVKRVVPAPLLSLHDHRKGNGGSTDRSEKNKIEIMTHDGLIAELARRLTGTSYLILIDDIWSVETWEKIRNWLPHTNIKDSKIIVTTRFQAVAAACSETDGTLHTVDVLSDDSSERLFNQGVSESQNSPYSKMVTTRSQAVGTESKGEGTDYQNSSKVCRDANSTGQSIDRVPDPQSSKIGGKEDAHVKIWKYCGGLPLVILTMAGLVGCNPTKNNAHWSNVCKSLFSEQAAPLTLDRVTRILDYCYNDLTADLKTCSLYLSIFPKGMKISRKRLTRRWISECFVTEKQGLSAEEVAETYFNQLTSRKIIHPVDHNSNGKVKSFKVHDMILEYIVSKSSEENFITVVGGHWLIPTPSNKVRRLSMQCSGSKHENSTKGMNLSQVRSLTVFGSQKRQPPFHSFNNRIIQVLDLEGWKGMTNKFMNNICKMVLLKYLSLRRTEVVEIPSKIEKLQYLETLDIRETNVEVLPKAFGQLKRLRCMLGGNKNTKKALKFPHEKNKEAMKALLILSGIEINEDSAAVEGLHQLTGLKKLAIYKLNIQDGGQTFKQLSSSIEYLCSCGLQTLTINDQGSDFIDSLDSMLAPPRYLVALELSGKMERPPKWIEYLKNLYKLTLSVTVLRTDTFKLIQHLPKLFSLTFTLSSKKDDRDIVDILEENKMLTDREIIVPPGGFKSLKLLRFFATLVPRLSFAVTKEEVMPELERIDMRFQAFEGIYGIETLNSLQEVHLSVDNQAYEITKFLVEELKESPKYVDGKYAKKWPKIIFD